MTVIQASVDCSQAAKSSEGLSFLQAIKKKYVDQEIADDRLVLSSSKIINTEIVLYGSGRVSSIQKQLRRLNLLDLSSMGIESAGNLHEISDCLTNVQILNLAKNLLTWEEIRSIVSILPNLKELILTSNPLVPSEKTLLDTEPCANKLHFLSLGEIFPDWSSIMIVLSKIWKTIEIIDLWNNRLSDLDMSKRNAPECFVGKIQVLKLSHNLFKTNSWLEGVGPIQELKELDLSSCQLESFLIDDKLSIQLQNLEVLNISFNYISNWRDISSLSLLPRLKNLLCIDNPLFLRDKSARLMTIGRLESIKILNRQEITAHQRRDAEIYYLRQTFPEYESHLGVDNDKFVDSHPRYQKLIEIYGIPMDLKKKQVVDKFLTIHLCFEDKVVKRKLPCDMRIANLKMLCKKLFALNFSENIELRCDNNQSSGKTINYHLDQEGQTLHFFSVTNGSKLMIEKN